MALKTCNILFGCQLHLQKVCKLFQMQESAIYSNMDKVYEIENKEVRTRDEDPTTTI